MCSCLAVSRRHLLLSTASSFYTIFAFSSAMILESLEEGRKAFAVYLSLVFIVTQSLDDINTFCQDFSFGSLLHYSLKLTVKKQAGTKAKIIALKLVLAYFTNLLIKLCICLVFIQSLRQSHKGFRVQRNICPSSGIISQAMKENFTAKTK